MNCKFALKYFIASTKNPMTFEFLIKSICFLELRLEMEKDDYLRCQK